MLGFIDSVDVYNVGQLRDKPSDKLTAREMVYRQFLAYRNFYAPDLPLLICEGETDNVYVTHAIRGLATEFPDLAELKEGKVRLKIRIYKYQQSSTAKILGLKGGGSSVLSQFIAAYRPLFKKFKATGLTKPVVVVYDNDAGAKGIRGSIKNVSGVDVRGKAFLHVVENLYAVPTPLVGGVKNRGLFWRRNQGGSDQRQDIQRRE
jgi:RNA-directed DNA polymerase